jgi:hypothetical protein
MSNQNQVLDRADNKRGGKRVWRNLALPSSTSLRRESKSLKQLSHRYLLSYEKSNPRPPTYEAAVLLKHFMVFWSTETEFKYCCSIEYQTYCNSPPLRNMNLNRSHYRIHEDKCKRVCLHFTVCKGRLLQDMELCRQALNGLLSRRTNSQIHCMFT